MMKTRDRSEALGRGETDKTLLHDYITVEELRACTSCGACVEECPVSIHPLDIIYQMRRQLVMEESNAPQEWTLMFSNIENNMAPGSPPRTNGTPGYTLKNMSMQIKTMAEYFAEGETPEVLFWVGCAGSIDQRSQRSPAPSLRSSPAPERSLPCWARKRPVRATPPAGPATSSSSR